MHRFIVWSNAFYLIPLAVAVYFHIWLAAAVVGLLFITSSGYHVFRTRALSEIDAFAAYVVIPVCLYLLYLGYATTAFWIAWVFFAIALYIRWMLDTKHDHEIFHGLWHFFAAAAITSSVIAAASQ